MLRGADETSQFDMTGLCSGTGAGAASRPSNTIMSMVRPPNRRAANAAALASLRVVPAMRS